MYIYHSEYLGRERELKDRVETTLPSLSLRRLESSCLFRNSAAARALRILS